MKRFNGITIVILALILGLLVTGTGLARQGRGMGQGPGSGDCPYADPAAVDPAQGRPGQGGFGTGVGPVVDIFAGDPVEVAGTVSEVGTYGQGIGIDTGDAVVEVFGIGPYRYWDLMAVDRPAVGDAIAVQGYQVAFSDGTTKIIAVTVAVADAEIQLRDPESGLPLWRGPGFGGRGFGHGNCPFAADPEAAPATE